MATGDDAKAAGYPLVSGTGLIRSGDDDINYTRDLIARVKTTIPVGKGAYRTAAGISSGAGDPTGGVDGDIYFKIL